MPGRIKDETGKRYGRLQVVRMEPKQPCQKGTFWICKCDCGTESHRVEGGCLRNGRVTSCGCYARERSSERARTHGRRDSREYSIWRAMKKRCYVQNASGYARYGGRGIKVCNRWRDSFENFYEDMGPAPEGMSLDRIDGDGDYAPSNCRWATIKQQQRNTCTNRLISYKNKTLTLVEWSEITGLASETIAARIKRGWSTAKALETPVVKTHKSAV